MRDTIIDTHIRANVLEVMALTCIRDDLELFANLNFCLQPGQILRVEGANGAGKTTLLRTLCGLITPAQGKIHWRGKPIHSLAEEYARELIYIGHRLGIKEELTAEENLRISSALDGGQVDNAAIWNALQRIGLAGHEELPTRSLSAGQKRRVALARLLLTDAGLWVLDEPFTALDRAAVEFLQEVIHRYIVAGGMVVLTSHQDVEIDACRVERLHLPNRERY